MKKDSKIALLYSSVYVGLGTIDNLCNYGSDWCFGAWTEYLTFLTFPVSILAFGIRYGMSDGFLIPVIIAPSYRTIVSCGFTPC